MSAVQSLDKYPVLEELGITKGTPEGYRAWQSSIDHQYRPDTALRELQQPVLALFGEQDELIDWQESEQILKDSLKAADNPDLTIKVFRNADHNLFRVGSQEFIDGYLKTMREWLRAESRRTHVRQ